MGSHSTSGLVASIGPLKAIGGEDVVGNPEWRHEERANTAVDLGEAGWITGLRTRHEINMEKSAGYFGGDSLTMGCNHHE